MFIRLVQDFGLESEVAKHLSHTYGDRAFSVAKLASLTGRRWPIGSYFKGKMFDFMFYGDLE